MTQRKKRYGLIGFLGLMAMIYMIVCPQMSYAAGKIRISYYYEEVCASCDGTKDFFELYNRVISSEDKKTFQAEIATYNTFMDSCMVQYEEVVKELGIPSGTSLPVLVVGDQWISGHEDMEAQMREVILSAESVEEESEGASADVNSQNDSKEDAAGMLGKDDEKENAGQSVGTVLEKNDNGAGSELEISAFWAEVTADIDSSDAPVVVLFSTNGCDDCNAVKNWFEENKNTLNCEVLEYNIIEKECLTELKAVFRAYEVPEEKQKVPAAFFGDTYLIGKDEIPTMTKAMLEEDSDNQVLSEMLELAAGGQIDSGEGAESMNIWTLAAAGLLAGFNPCSISMLLMLLSLLISEKASIWKSGLLYLLGKYVAYISIGMVIFITASQISNETMEKVGGMMNMIMGILFAVAAVFYIIDAVRVYRQDYGNIKTQLPVGLRRMNHNLIKKVSSAGGIMQPLMILVLGIVISFGEFFCTGQIYMASITYLLKDQVKAAIFPFLVYTTAMSLPAVIMILLIQRTRNTDAVSDFMFRNLGVIKIFNAVLFTAFALYFLIF